VHERDATARRPPRFTTTALFPIAVRDGYPRRVSKLVVATFHAKGHLIDSGLLSDALEAVQAAGASYRVLRLDIGKQRLDESQLELEVQAPNKKVFERVRADLMSLGLSETETQDAQFAEVDIPGTAPEGFYSTTNLATEVRVAGQWLPVQGQRMDATVVDDAGTLRCVKLRDLAVGQRVVIGFAGIRITPFTTRKLQEGKFGFMQGGVSSERRLAAQVEEVVAVWRRVRADGKKVILVAGPVVVHVGAAPTLAAILHAGLVNGLLSGNALAVHDIEAALYGTSLGIELAHGRQAVHGHMHHMRAINSIRRAGGIAAAVQQRLLKTGIMHACVQAKVPFALAGSIRDDGPLPDTQMDLIVAQGDYAKILENAGLVVILSSMLHGIGTGNMIAADVMTVCVDIHPAVVSKLSDRGSAQSQGIVTDVGAFLTVLAEQLGVAVKA
jgi:lysine-ketoglutarate reductase/saccharopine dehydrogenase-like protein (TIGR00300 family)